MADTDISYYCSPPLTKGQLAKLQKYGVSGDASAIQTLATQAFATKGQELYSQSVDFDAPTTEQAQNAMAAMAEVWGPSVEAAWYSDAHKSSWGPNQLASTVDPTLTAGAIAAIVNDPSYLVSPPLTPGQLTKLRAYTGASTDDILNAMAQAVFQNKGQVYFSQCVDFDCANDGFGIRLKNASAAIAAVWGAAAYTAWVADKKRSWWDQFGGYVIGAAELVAGAVIDAVSFGTVGTALIAAGVVSIVQDAASSGPLQSKVASQLGDFGQPGSPSAIAAQTTAAVVAKKSSLTKYLGVAGLAAGAAGLIFLAVRS